MNGSESIARQCFTHSVASLMGAGAASELFDLLTEIASLPYENAENSGFVLLCRPHERFPVTVEFTIPFEMRNTRGVRKMLQISDRQLCLACDGAAIYGFVPISVIPAGAMTIRFFRNGIWELTEGESVVLQTSASGETLPPCSLNESRFSSEIRRVSANLSDLEIERLWLLVSVARRQMRGTNLLISARAASEAERLASQCTRITPAPLTPLLMERLTSIDGTVILDTQGVCHAIGAILDGPATARGDRTRGGRYNSALMYIDDAAVPGLVVVISQDGMVDLVCRSQGVAGK